MIFMWFAIFMCISTFHVSSQDQISCDILNDFNRVNNLYCVRCQGVFSDGKLLHNILSNISKPIKSLELYNSSLDLLPEYFFREIQNSALKQIVFSHTYISLLSIPENDSLSFYSIKSSVESFEIYDSSFVFAWDFSALASFVKLETVIIENSEFLTVPNSFKLWPNLRFLQLTTCQIQWIHEEAFKENYYLSICSLSKNLLKTIPRSVFPKPALHLWSLDLSFNKLETLPKDAFEDMNALKELKLDNNRLNVKGDVYKVVWNDLTQLWLDGNDMICWRLCPIISRSKKEKNGRPQFFDSSKCILPPKGKILLDSFFC